MKAKKKNTGKPSEDEWQQILRRFGKRVFIHRNTDAADVRGRSSSQVKATVPSQPSDFVVVIDGDCHFAEVKSTIDQRSFKRSSIRTTQLAAARMILAAGGSYIVYVHRLATGDWYKIPIAAILADSRATFKWAELQPYKWELAYAQ